jgi:hypothetical protein
MPLFGHHEWRSKGLLNPWDSFLSGSYFVDLQGSYQSLPAPIRINTVDSPNLLPPDKVEQADFSLLAWKAIDAPLHLAQRKSEMRRKLDRFVPRAKEPSNSAVNQAAAVTYNQDNNINWDASIFSISSKSASAGVLTLIGP